MYFGFEKHIKRYKRSHNYECWYDAKMLRLYIYTLVSATLAQVQTTFSFWRATPNLFISTLLSSLYSLFTFYGHLRVKKQIER